MFFDHQSNEPLEEYSIMFFWTINRIEISDVMNKESSQWWILPNEEKRKCCQRIKYNEKKCQID